MFPRPLQPLLLLLLLLGACEKPPELKLKQYPLPEEAKVSEEPVGQPSDLLVYAMMGDDIKTVNDFVAEDVPSSTVISFLFDSLTTRDPHTGEMQPALARSWDISEDMKSYTFHLRKGLRWSDGQPLTADDVVFTYNTILDKRFNIRSSFFLQVDGKPLSFTKIDDLTVRIDTPEIYAPLLLFVGGMPVLPKHVLEPYVEDESIMKQWSKDAAREDPRSIVSNGQYVIESYQPAERIVLVRNPNYYQVDSEGNRLPYIRRVIFKFLSDSNAMMVAFSVGKTDLESITPDNVAWVRRTSEAYDFTVHEIGPTPSTGFVWFNQNPRKNEEGKPFVDPVKLAWFTDTRFRQALSYGVDRQRMVDGVLFGMGSPLYGNVSPANVQWFNPAIRTYAYNPERSRELLKEAGFQWNQEGKLLDAKGNLVEFTLITNQGNDTRYELSLIFKDNMSDLGIEVELQFIDFNTLLGKISDNFDYEACLLGLSGGAPDPNASLDTLSSGGRMHMWNPQQETPATDWEARVDELMNAQMKTVDPKQRKVYYDEVQAIIAEQQPFIYLVTPTRFVGMKNKWQNVRIPKIGSALWNLENLWAR